MNELQRLHDAVLLAASVCLLAAALHTQSVLPRAPVHLDLSTARIKAAFQWQLEEMGKMTDDNPLLYQLAN